MDHFDKPENSLNLYKNLISRAVDDKYIGVSEIQQLLQTPFKINALTVEAAQVQKGLAALENEINRKESEWNEDQKKDILASIKFILLEILNKIDPSGKYDVQ
jgi:flagellar biosynthesis chaperone FliJ